MKACFLSDTELILTLYRLAAPSFESRPFVLSANRQLVESLERITKQSEKWKVGEWELHSLTDSLLDDSLSSSLSSFLGKISISVRDERENEWIDEKLKLKISCDSSVVDTAIVDDLSVKKCVDLIGSVLSAALKNTDSFAVLRLFDHVCPEILPVVKRLAAASELTILQTIFSSLMKLEIDGGDLEDLVLRRHEKMLRTFNTTVDRIEEQLCEDLSTTRTILKVLDLTAEWISSLSSLSSDVASALSKALTYVKGHLLVVITNFSALQSCSTQKRPDYLKGHHIVLRLLLDRLTIFDTVSLSNVYATPAFKTPVAVAAPETPVTAVTQVVEDSTPKRRDSSDSPAVYSKFLNFDTPSTVAPPTKSEISLQPEQDENSQDHLVATPSSKNSKADVSKPRSRLTRKSTSKLFTTSDSKLEVVVSENGGDKKEETVDKRQDIAEVKRKRKSAEQPKVSKPKSRRKSEPVVPTGQRKITSFFTGKQ